MRNAKDAEGDVISYIGREKHKPQTAEEKAKFEQLKAESRMRVERAEAALTKVVNRMQKKYVEQEMAKNLLRRFSSPGAVLEADKYHLAKAGLTERDALLLSLIPGIVRHIDRASFGPHPKLATLKDAEKFLYTCFMGLSIERFYMLALENNGKLMECVYLQSGNEDSAPFYVKQVLSEIVRTKARAIVISHNHPNDTPRPSQADMDCTLTLMEALGAIGVPLVDHVIMVGRHALTMRGFGYINEGEWRNQPAGRSPLHDWLIGWSLDEAVDALTDRPNFL